MRAARPVPSADPLGLFDIDRAAYDQVVDWGAIAAGNQADRALHAGRVYAERWLAAATPEDQAHVTSLVGQSAGYVHIPGRIDGDLLRFAEDHDVDTWGPVWVKIKVRDGFWAVVHEVVDDLGPN